MAQRWKIEAVLVNEDEEVDWLEEKPGPVMRDWLQGYRAKVLGSYNAQLRIRHLISGRAKVFPIVPTRRIGWSANVNGGLVTLEQAANIMRGELEALHEAERQIN